MVIQCYCNNEVGEEENNVWRKEKRKNTQGCSSEAKPNTCNSIIKVLWLYNIGAPVIGTKALVVQNLTGYWNSNKKSS